MELAGDRIEDSLPGRQGRLLFAYLVLNRERAVRRDELLDVLWPEEGPPPSGDSLLARPLSRLRKALGAGRLEGRDELMLHLGEQAWVDWEAAGRSLREARTALAEEDWRAALDRGQAALEIADRGLLPGLTATWIEDRRVELADMRLEALELVAGSGVRLGTGELLAGRTGGRGVGSFSGVRQGGAHRRPYLPEGNTAEALRAYEDIRVLLREELGTTPGPALQRLHERLLAGDEVKEGGPRAAAVLPRGAGTVSSRLPRRTGSRRRPPPLGSAARGSWSD